MMSVSKPSFSGLCVTIEMPVPFLPFLPFSVQVPSPLPGGESGGDQPEEGNRTAAAQCPPRGTVRST